jgi:hypothetical protein
MKRTLLVSLFISLCFVTVLAQQEPESGAWVNVAPEKSGFSILMPGKPDEGAAAVEGRPNTENRTLTLETKLAGYVVSYVQFPDEVTDPDAIKLLLDSGRDGGVAASKGELTSEKEIKLGGYSGREWVMKLPGGLFTTARAYWVKRSLYQTVFVTAPSANDTPDLVKLRNEAGTKFLDSFKLSADVK